MKQSNDSLASRRVTIAITVGFMLPDWLGGSLYLYCCSIAFEQLPVSINTCYSSWHSLFLFLFFHFRSLTMPFHEQTCLIRRFVMLPTQLQFMTKRWNQLKIPWCRILVGGKPLVRSSTLLLLTTISSRLVSRPTTFSAPYISVPHSWQAL